MRPLQLIKSWKNIEVIQALTSNGITVVKRSLLLLNEKIESGFLREIRIFNEIHNVKSKMTEAIIKPLGIYIMSNTIEPDLSKSSSNLNYMIENAMEDSKVCYLCIEMEKASGDIMDISDRNPILNLRIMKRAIEGIVALHSLGYCYADLKPDNILYFTNSKDDMIDFKLIDFNATFLNSRPQDAKYTTPNTMSPELFHLIESFEKRYQVQVSEVGFDFKRSDYWSIGCLAYYLLTNKSIIMAETIDQYREEISILKINDLRNTISNMISNMMSDMMDVDDDNMINILWSIINSTLHIDPLERTFEPLETLKLITEILGDSQVDIISDNSNSNPDPNSYSDVVEDMEDYESLDDTLIESILMSVIKTAIKDINRKIDIDTEIKLIINTLFNLVNKHMSDIKIDFTDLVPNDNVLISNFFKHVCYILGLKYVLNFLGYDISSKYLYSIMNEYCIRMQTNTNNSDEMQMMMNIVNRMILNRTIFMFLKLDTNATRITQTL